MMKRKIAAAIIITSLVTWGAESVEAATKKKTMVQDVSVKNVIAPAMINYDGNILENAIVFASSTHSSTSVTAITDNNLKSAWNSGGYAPAWIEISVPVNLRKYPIKFLKLTPTQDPAGTTKHIISAKVSGAWTNVQTVHQYTSDGKTIIVELAKPVTNAEKIKIETVDSPSWVAWYEISAFNNIPAPQKFLSTPNASTSTVVTSERARVAFAGEPGYTPANDSGCKVFNPSVEPGDSVTWSGSCSNGYASGRGTLQWFSNGADAGQYQGDMKEGKRHGTGTYKWTNGSSYSGGWADNKLHGKGVYIYADGTKDDASFKDGKYDGKGLRSKANGDIIAILGKDDKIVKNEKLFNKLDTNWQVDISGCRFKLKLVIPGDVQGTARDKTRLYNEMTSKWSGACKDGYAEGQGTMQFYYSNRESDYFIGEMKRGMATGLGEYHFKNDDHDQNRGSYYKGNFNYSRFDGYGKIYDANTNKILNDGEWFAGDVFSGYHNKEFCKGYNTILWNSTCYGTENKRGWYENGDFITSCSSYNGCKAFITYRDQIKINDNERRCEQARDLNDKLDSNDRFFDYSQCVAERTLNSHLASKNPQSMYLAAGQYERDGNTYYAQKVYSSLIQRFPKSQWSIKANDRLLSIKADNDARSRQSEFESNRRQEAQKATESCRNRKSSCYSSCASYETYSERERCRDRCHSICSE